MRPGNLAQQLGLLRQFARVEVAEQDADGDLGHSSVNAIWMQKAVALRRSFRRQRLNRQPIQKCRRQPHGVHHSALGD
jgi:hypothetical protein